ncbi:hypothetical protein [Cryobacterium sp.]|jgi:hypothetical protein|uniref:hypothetical protein n=1 Tax=Cryobacterium sp. TaxID=1926290 RepID=UPI0026019833|nr:hypothetical protein [Cryobacterium sp.]MCU1447580.1 hypothetical protein [Cryobacterium sp.]MCU1543205.1 hypothetical protein [Microbacteriaceae bacterium]
MNSLDSLSVVFYLYWVALLLVTLASLILAVLAFRLGKQPFVIASAGALGAALLLAAVPVVEAPVAFTVVMTLAGLALAVIGGGPAAVLALHLATQDSVAPGSHGGILVGTETTPGGVAEAGGTDAAAGTAQAAAVHEVLRGGLTIGVLERLAVAGAILAGFPEALAVVVAIKGVGRFTELASSEARERFIIGTFASLIWACACVILVNLAQS